MPKNMLGTATNKVKRYVNIASVIFQFTLTEIKMNSVSKATTVYFITVKGLKL